jgi:signal transduction histidine kinase
MIFNRLLDSLVHPPESGRHLRSTVLTLLILIVGAADYLSGVSISVAIFYLIPIVLATAWHGQGAGSALVLVTTAIRLISDGITLSPESIPLHTFWNAGAGLVLFLFVVWLVDSLVTLHRHLEAKVAARTAELEVSIAEKRRLELEVLEAATRERNAFGRELHDGLGQHLVATALASQVLQRSLGEGPAAGAAGRIVGYMEEAIARTRNLARGLLLARIEPEDLARELDELAAGASGSGLQCRLAHGGQAVTATPMQCAQLFRIAQEALANAMRHAGARSVNITLASDEHALCLTVEDDGRGFPTEAGESGVGLRSMRYRAGLAGASLSIVSGEGTGTQVICRLPVASAPPI